MFSFSLMRLYPKRKKKRKEEEEEVTWRFDGSEDSNPFSSIGMMSGITLSPSF